MAIHAFDGLQKLDMIYVVQDGYYDPIKKGIELHSERITSHQDNGLKY